MGTRSIADESPAVALVDSVEEFQHVRHDAIVPDSSGYLWVAVCEALRRRQERACAQHPACAERADFAAAMRRVEDEVYNAD